MGLIYQHIRLSNAAKPELEEVDAKALVDTGANDLCIPRLVAMEAMDVLIDPRRQHLIPDPDYPNIPGAMAMGFRTSRP
ncbi:hypothetical protein [uncultured Sphingomonas sp.]|uniref:hypothetical protein n=1 Tax=uncultured Sphingomonas sp. TaxID=158754 RepID=UPI0035CA1B3E